MVLQDALELRDRRDAGGLTDDELVAARNRLLAELAWLGPGGGCDQPTGAPNRPSAPRS